MTRRHIAGISVRRFRAGAVVVGDRSIQESRSISTAPAEEEMVAIGIEKAAAKKIIEARPYRAKTELVSKQLLTRVQYDKLKDQLVAKQPAIKEASPIKPAGK